MKYISQADKNDFGQNILSEIIDWISLNLEPDQVFTKDDLYEWARKNGCVSETPLSDANELEKAA
jgi:hypothetical protein